MSINNAMKFIREVDANPNFRKECYSCKTKEELFEMLEKQELGFNDFDFEEAVNMMLFKCQTYEQADGVKQVQWWYTIFN